jgi:hypothetical protein
MYLYRIPGKGHDHPTSNLFNNQFGRRLIETHIHTEQVADLDGQGVVAELDDQRHMPPVLAAILPKGDGVRCHYDNTTRVLLLDFTQVDCLKHQHKQSLGKLFELPQYTVVCKGMLPSYPKIEKDLNGKMGLLGLGNAPHYKFRLFEKTKTSCSTIIFQERDGFWCMRPSDYFTYLDKHYGRNTDPMFTLQKKTDEVILTVTLDATNVVLYMIDVDMPAKLPALHSWYREQFKLKEVLPGGDWCVMHWVSGTNDYIAISPSCFFGHYKSSQFVIIPSILGK